MTAVMTIQDFYGSHSGQTIFTRWMLEKDMNDFLGMGVTGGVILVEALTNDSLNGHISPELFAAFHNLMGTKADTAEEIRNILVEKLMQGDTSVLGLINKIKGQVGENIFIETAAKAGFSAHLADLKNQEAWDCCLISPHDGMAQYVQVKTYADPDAVVEAMKVVAHKVAAGQITDGGKAVHAISFAVPQDIHAAVVAKAQAAGLDTHVWAIDLSAQDAAHVVRQGFDSVAPESLGHFFSHMATGTLTAAALHTVTQAFLLRKGASEAMARAVAFETALSASGSAAAQGVNVTVVKGLGIAAKGFPAIALLMATGITARGVLRCLLARRDYAGFLRQENTLLAQRQTALLENACTPVP